MGTSVVYRFSKSSGRGKSNLLMCYSSRGNGSLQPRCRGRRSPEPHWHLVPPLLEPTSMLRAAGSRVYLAAKFGRLEVGSACMLQMWRPCRVSGSGLFPLCPKGTLRDLNSNQRLLFLSSLPCRLFSKSSLVLLVTLFHSLSPIFAF